MQQENSPLSANRFTNHTFSLGLAFLLLGLCFGGLHLYSTSLPPLLPSSAWTVGLGLLACGLGLYFSRTGSPQLKLSVFGFAAVCCLVILSDIPSRPFSLYLVPFLRLEILLLALVIFFLPGKVFRYLPGLALLLTSGAALAGFFIASSGRLLFSDDHPAFLFRLMLLQENFPNIPFFNPLWNGGFDCREFFPSGILGFFFIFSPLLVIFEAQVIYNLMISILLFVLIPLCSFLAARLNGSARTTSLLCATLAMTSSLLWYRWALHYGTLGFITSCCLLPLNLALLARILGSATAVSFRWVALSAISISLMLFWSLSILFLLPILLLFLVQTRGRIFRRDRTTLALLLLLNLPWMLIFAKSSGLMQFVRAEQNSVSAEITKDEAGQSKAEAIEKKPTAFKSEAKMPSPKSVIEALRIKAGSSNLIVLFLAIPGLALIAFKASRQVWIFTSIWLLLLATIIAPLKPQLELDRMLVVLVFLLCQPTACALAHLFESVNHQPWTRIVTSLIGATFLVSPQLLYLIASNQSSEKYYFAEPVVGDLSEAIQRHGGLGRVAFAGFILHELSGGHVAPLAAFTQRPLMASSYQHNLWEYKDLIPVEYLKRKDEGVEEFYELYNVTAVVTHDRFWRKWFEKRPEVYTRLWRNENFSLFSRKPRSSASWFYQGQGQLIAQSSNQVRLRLETSNAVIKFNYFSFLKVPGCEISPYPLSGGISLVKLSNCSTGSELVMQSVSPLQRLLN